VASSLDGCNPGADSVIHKVNAYITHGHNLLVFRHTEFPEAGIQVPAGSLEEGELPDEAVLREAQEETGLSGLRLRSFLGVRDFDLSIYGIQEVERRYFYHLELVGDAPSTWLHYEWHPSDGSPAPIEFEFYWVGFPNDVPELSGNQGEMLLSLQI
jgi:8-oxo-dGTP pyrophosphatase MutT (NUDIX family)